MSVQVETWTSLEAPDSLHVRVTLDDGSRHRRTLTARDDADWRDWKVAGHFWRDSEKVAAQPTSEHFTEGHRRAAVLVDQCLAVETLFPHLRERLPA